MRHFHIAAPVLTMATAAFVLATQARPDTIDLKSQTQPSCSSCEYRLPSGRMYGFQQTPAPVNPGTPAADEPVTPQSRFAAAESEARAKLTEMGLSQSGLSVVSGQSITYTASSGKVLHWEFNTDGYVSTFSEGTATIRYHHEGDVTLGFDVKDSAQGYSNFVTIRSVVRDNDGYVISSTWHPTGQTVTYNTPSSSPSNPIASRSIRSKQSSVGLDRVPTDTRQAKLLACEAARNDASRQNKADMARCESNAHTQLQQCLSNVGSATWGGVLGGAGIGIAIGTLLGPPGVIGGAIVGGLIGGGTSQQQAINGCYGTANAAKNGCREIYNIDRQEIIDNYNACVARAQ